MMKKMKYDDPIKEIHALRRRLAKESGYDIREYVRRLQAFEEQLRKEGRIKLVPGRKHVVYTVTEEIPTKKVAEPALGKLAAKRRTK